jgi:hypothetical protein
MPGGNADAAPESAGQPAADRRGGDYGQQHTAK